MIAITTIMDAKIQALIAGGLIVIGMKSAIHQVLSLGTIMSNVRKLAPNMAQKKTKGLNVTMLTPKTKTTGNAIGKILTAQRRPEMLAGIS